MKIKLPELSTYQFILSRIMFVVLEIWRLTLKFKCLALWTSEVDQISHYQILLRKSMVLNSQIILFLNIQSFLCSYQHYIPSTIPQL